MGVAGIPGRFEAGECAKCHHGASAPPIFGHENTGGMYPVKGIILRWGCRLGAEITPRREQPKWADQCLSSNYWSATTNANNTSNAWNVNLNNGNVNNDDKTNTNFVWCVRGGAW